MESPGTVDKREKNQPSEVNKDHANPSPPPEDQQPCHMDTEIAIKMTSLQTMITTTATLKTVSTTLTASETTMKAMNKTRMAF